VFLLIGLAWTICVGLSAAWNRHEIERSLDALARQDLRSSFEKDSIYRKWVTMHGGVYAPVTETTPPNPYLAHLPERDIVTTNGRALTLINPAYMTRQVHELGWELYGLRGHITSLDPLRPGNAPDPWEAEALQAFERGTDEVISVEEMDGEPALRFMKPFVVVPGCLKCHGHQDYAVGDIRGGISVSAPSSRYLHAQKHQQTTMLLAHLAIGLLGWGGLFLAAWWLARTRRRTAHQERRSQARLEQAAQTWQATFDAARDAIWVVGPDLRIQRCNLAAGDMFVLPPAEAVGEYCWAFEGCDSVEAAETMVMRSRDSLERQTCDIEQRDQSFSVSIDPTIDKHGAFAGAVFIARDITRQLRDRESQDRLERELEGARRVEAVGRLGSGVAHEFNNLLTVIGTYAELVSTELAPDSLLAADIAQIQLACNQAAELTEKLLASGQRSRVAQTHTDPNELIDAHHAQWQLALPPGVMLETTLSDHPVAVSAEPTSLAAMVQALITNAGEASAPSSVIHLRVARSVPPHTDRKVQVAYPSTPLVVIRVQDHGTGMPPDVACGAFEPFFTTKGEVEGRGMGLAAVQGLAKQLGGTVQLYSTEGVGTTVEILLPHTERAVAEQPSPSEAPRLSPRTGTLLLVDDQREIRTAVERMLRGWDVQVLSAADGASALSLFEAHETSISLLLTDVMMPGIGGPELASRVRERAPGLPVVFMSGNATYAELVDQIRGPTHYLPKPFDKAGLLSMLARVMPLREAEPLETKPDMSSVSTPSAVTSVLPPVPDELRVSIERAAEVGDTAQLRALCDGPLAAMSPTLAAEIGSRIDRYDYDGILKILERTGTTTP